MSLLSNIFNRLFPLKNPPPPPPPPPKPKPEPPKPPASPYDNPPLFCGGCGSNMLIIPEYRYHTQTGEKYVIMAFAQCENYQDYSIHDKLQWVTGPPHKGTWLPSDVGTRKNIESSSVKIHQFNTSSGVQGTQAFSAFTSSQWEDK